MKILNILVLLSIFILVSCSKGGSDGGDGTKVEVPVAASLVFPDNNKKCTEGTIVNSIESAIVFQWNASINTDSYEVNVRDLSTNTSFKKVSASNSVSITLKRDVGYEWYVVSKNNTTTEIATSEKWKFYNQGEGEKNYAPFPAEAIYPTRGAVFATPGTINLEWKGSDVDNDIVSYEIFIGNTTNPSTSIGKTQLLKAPTTTTANKTYYWTVKTLDAAGNSSTSEVFDFKVR